MKKLIVFDFDGTLINTMDSILDSESRLVQKYGYKQLKYSEKFRNQTFLDIIRKDLGLSITKTLIFLRRMGFELERNLVKSKPYPGIKTLLQNLEKKGYEIGLVSTNITHQPKKHIQKVLEENDLRKYFSFIEHVSVFRGKTSKLKDLVKHKKLEKNEVVYVGDEIADIKSCKKIGIPIISVAWGFQSKRFLQKYHPDFIVDKPSDILAIIKKN